MASFFRLLLYNLFHHAVSLPVFIVALFKLPVKELSRFLFPSFRMISTSYNTHDLPDKEGIPLVLSLEPLHIQFRKLPCMGEFMYHGILDCISRSAAFNPDFTVLAIIKSEHTSAAGYLTAFTDRFCRFQPEVYILFKADRYPSVMKSTIFRYSSLISSFILTCCCLQLRHMLLPSLIL